MPPVDAVQCYSCVQQAHSDRPARENVWEVPGWRVATALSSSLAGWLVVVPTRHIEALDELSDEESQALGPLLRNVSRALKTVTGCVKTYVLLLAEAPGFTHLHFHVVPRMADLQADRKGAAVFAYLKEEPLSEEQRDEVARMIREAMLRG